MYGICPKGCAKEALVMGRGIYHKESCNLYFNSYLI